MMLYSNLRSMVFGVLFSFAVIVYCLILAKPQEKNYAYSKITPGARAENTLKFLTVISRHGNRRLMGFPKDPYPMNDTSYWPYETGELTTQGRMGMYRLGKKIRQLYDGYLSQDYNTHEVKASSTAMDRVLMSGQIFLTALYPPQGVFIWNDQISWQPIPIYSDSPDNSAKYSECPRYLQEHELYSEKFLSDYAMQLKEIESRLANYTGISFSDKFWFFSVWDTLLTEDLEGYKLPGWSKQVYPQPLDDIIGKFNIAYFGATDLMVRTTIGLFTKEIMDALKSKSNGTLSPDKKMHYYSGHDISLLNLQVALGISRSDIIAMVNPVSTMIFELHQNPDTSVYSVQVLYIDGASLDQDPIFLHIPDCPHPCELTRLTKITSKFENVDYDKECKPTIT